nr:MAG TPA: hypothetical protein [Caudoviricetes sp.]DAJ84613.1 MAG TPA: hypothetical protein [Caudoviricetes sp.]
MAKLVGQFSGFEQDMTALEKQVKDAFRASRPALAEEMRQCLREHVVEDVYDKLEPEEYVRRRGTKGLADMNASATVYSDERDGGMNLTLLYHPSGATDGNGEPIDPHVDGDDLINRIEKNDPAYNWGRRPKNRPFFRNFVEEMLGGRAEETLVRAMNGADPTLGLEATFWAMELEDDDYH